MTKSTISPSSLMSTEDDQEKPSAPPIQRPATIFIVPKEQDDISCTTASQRSCSATSSELSYKKSLEHDNSSELRDSSSRNHPFSLRWLIYLPLLFLISNAAAYTTLFWLLKTLESAHNNTSLHTRNFMIRTLFPSNSELMSKLCTALYGQQLPSYCTSPPAPVASESLDKPVTSSITGSRTVIALLAGALAFLIGSTVALLTVDFILHRHVLNKPNLVQQKLNDEEKLAELKVSWSRAPAPAPVVRLSKTNEQERQRLSVASVRHMLNCFTGRGATAVQRQQSVTVLSMKRWLFSRAFLIVPLWIPLTQHVYRWEFCLVQALVGLLVGGILHRRSRWEVRWIEC